MQLNQALKEWAIAVNALEAGETILLLRKGGIRERGGRFSVPYREVLLYPTYEHQKPDLLKPEYADRVTPVESGWHPERIAIGSWAEVTDILPMTLETEAIAADLMAQLQPYHIWSDRMVSDRLKWKPRQPLYLLLLRTHKLSVPRDIPYRQEYGGCRSWISLSETISLSDSTPVLADAEYRDRCDRIRQICTSV